MNKVASSAAMSGPIIPAELWPEGAHLHTWDSNGLGSWLRPSYGAWHLWASDILLPPGHDWRVPVMRPSAAQEFNGWYCAHCQRGVDASEVTFHEQHEVCGRVITDDRPPSPQPSQAIDLEQFRAALVALSDYAYERHGDTDHPHCLEADRLLALINQQPNVRSSSEHSDSLPATRSNTTHNLEKERGEDGKNG